MTIIYHTYDASPEQQIAIHAVEKINREVSNHDVFSVDDRKRLLKDIQNANKLCKRAFNTTMYSWQVQRYTIQMHLENTHQFIFRGNDKLAWTMDRWKDAVEHELAIHFFEEENPVLYDFQLRLMCYWLMFQYFNIDGFKGSEYEKVVDITFMIVRNLDDTLIKCKSEIRKWRVDNKQIIEDLNYYQKEWRKEKTKYKRLVGGKMKSNEVELYHMIGVSLPKLSFEDNIKRVAVVLGLSLKSAVRLGNQIGYNQYYHEYNMFVLYDDCKVRYEKEYKWAKKVLLNGLTKKEKKEFWKHHSILNPLTLFRTFENEKPDLIPAKNPLETSENQRLAYEERETHTSEPFSFSCSFMGSPYSPTNQSIFDQTEFYSGHDLFK